MGWTPPGRLFHAVVLAGAAMGAGSCKRVALVDSRPTDAGAATDLRIDIGRPSDAPAYDVGFDIVFGPGPDGTVRDAGSTEPYDAGCDTSCGSGSRVDPRTCQCIIVIA